MCGTSFTAKKKAYKLAIDGNLMFDEKPVASNSNVTITKIELITVKNEQEIDRKDITSNVTTQSYHIPVNVSYDAKYGDKFCIYVLAKDSLGYTHKTLAYFWNDLDEHTHNSITAVMEVLKFMIRTEIC